MEPVAKPKPRPHPNHAHTRRFPYLDLSLRLELLYFTMLYLEHLGVYKHSHYYLGGPQPCLKAEPAQEVPLFPLKQ